MKRDLIVAVVLGLLAAFAIFSFNRMSALVGEKIESHQTFKDTHSIAKICADGSRIYIKNDDGSLWTNEKTRVKNLSVCQ